MKVAPFAIIMALMTGACAGNANMSRSADGTTNPSAISRPAPPDAAANAADAHRLTPPVTPPDHVQPALPRPADVPVIHSQAAPANDDQPIVGCSTVGGSDSHAKRPSFICA